MSKTTKEIVEEVLSIQTTKKLWSANYRLVLPFTPQSFPMGAILPAILYMFRWGHRRGKGLFAETYSMQQAAGKKALPTVESVVEKLVNNNEYFTGLSSPTTMAILGDMILSFCLENSKHQTGRTEQIQRAFPTHYMASWIDLPYSIAHLRYVPEMVCAILAKQDEGEFVQRTNKNSKFAIGSGFENNILLSLFGTGMHIRGQHVTDLRADNFSEDEEKVGLDQLLTIRIAQGCGEAPVKARGAGESEQIPNQLPLATKAAKYFREDFSVFVQAYGATIPRQTFLQMLESCLALGLSNIYISTIKILLEWEKKGTVPTIEEQRSWPFFVDCSNGNDIKLRRLAEESMFDFIRRFERFPAIMMCLRIIDDKVRYDRNLRESLPSTYPDATEFINLLGSIYSESHPHAGKILNNLDEACLKLADTLRDEEQASEIQELLKRSTNPLLRLAEALCALMGDKTHRGQYIKTLNSSLMVNEPNGLAQKRKTPQKGLGGKKTIADARSIVLTNTMLDFIVHRHLRKAAKGKGASALTFIELLQLMKERYGLYVDEAPPGMSIPIEVLLHNKRILERRLRDLGVLVGVNDAESMKRLRQRFSAAGDV